MIIDELRLAASRSDMKIDDDPGFGRGRLFIPTVG